MVATALLHTLILCPRVEELDIVITELQKVSSLKTPSNKLFFPAEEFSDLGLVVGVGGQGKVQFALHASHALERYPSVNTLICMGAAGALAPQVRVGDVVVATSVIEHDYKSHLKKKSRVVHRSEPDESISKSISHEYQVHLGSIASGDEDVFGAARKTELIAQTNALAVAWEGAGGARAARFHKKKFVEWRGITDDATTFNVSVYQSSLQVALKNTIATFLSHGS